jgi:hypothetical protein
MTAVSACSAFGKASSTAARPDILMRCIRHRGPRAWPGQVTATGS